MEYFVAAAAIGAAAVAFWGGGSASTALHGALDGTVQSQLDALAPLPPDACVSGIDCF